MKPEVETSLEALLQKRENQKLASERRTIVDKERKENNLTAFATARDNIIRPALTEIVQVYVARGFPARILEKNEEANSKGGTSRPYIKLSLEPETYSDSGTMPAEFTVYFEKNKNEVWIHKSTRSSASPGETLPLDRVSGEWIHEQFLQYASQPY
jgi:cellulase/cellobiase CelA1